MDLTDLAQNEAQLTIAPIVGWRRWMVTPRWHWEQGSGPILRGAWGRAWNTSRLTARCLRPPTGSESMGRLLDGLDAGRHPEPAPHVDCACGIYAEKADSIDLSRNPRLAGRPTVSGFVEMSGRVLEGTSGFRARHADIVGPLELSVLCGGGDPGVLDACNRPAASVLTRPDMARGACEEHASLLRSFAAVELEIWADDVIGQLEAVYETPIFYIEKENQ